jgi:hypothetical protein
LTLSPWPGCRCAAHLWQQATKCWSSLLLLLLLLVLLYLHLRQYLALLQPLVLSALLSWCSALLSNLLLPLLLLMLLLLLLRCTLLAREHLPLQTAPLSGRLSQQRCSALSKSRAAQVCCSAFPWPTSH